VAALRCEGIDAPCVFGGPINGESFKAYVEQVLAPALRPGDIVVMDNLGSHKGSAIRRAIRAAGAHVLFLPPCSPDLNPINPSAGSGGLRKAQDTSQRMGQNSPKISSVCQSAEFSHGLKTHDLKKGPI
jgi:hypothetical protein